MAEYRVALVGSCGVGKSAITIQMVQYHFIDNYDPTIEDSYRKRCVIDEMACLLDILDTAGHGENIAPLNDLRMNREGILLVFSLASRVSFDEINLFYNLYVSTAMVPPAAILLGNKCDLKENERQVSIEEAEELATHLQIPFLATSARVRINIEESFFGLVREIRKRKYPHLATDNRNRRRCVFM